MLRDEYGVVSDGSARGGDGDGDGDGDKRHRGISIAYLVTSAKRILSWKLSHNKC